MVSAVHDCNTDSVNAALAKVAQQCMPDVPLVMKLSELLEAARGEFHKEEHEAFFAHYEPSEYGGGRLCLDSDESLGSGYGSKTHRAQHQIAFTEGGEVYSLKLCGSQITPASRPTVISRFDGILMAMYVGRTRIKVDMDADDVKSAAQEQYD